MFFEPSEHYGMVNTILSHFSVRRPLPADNREQARFGDGDGMLSRKHGGAGSFAGVDQGANAGEDTEDIGALRSFREVIAGGLENEVDFTVHRSGFKSDIFSRGIG